jgi:hypothetical protein
VRVFAVWEPILVTDLAPPVNAVLGRLTDPRVQQYWDRRHALSDRMTRDARPPQPAQDCCERAGHLWDLAAVYPPGALWSDRMPTATIFNGTVLDIADQIGEALAPIAPR